MRRWALAVAAMGVWLWPLGSAHALVAGQPTSTTTPTPTAARLTSTVTPTPTPTTTPTPAPTPTATTTPTVPLVAPSLAAPTAVTPPSTWAPSTGAAATEVGILGSLVEGLGSPGRTTLTGDVPAKELAGALGGVAERLSAARSGLADPGAGSRLGADRAAVGAALLDVSKLQAAGALGAPLLSVQPDADPALVAAQTLAESYVGLLELGVDVGRVQARTEQAGSGLLASYLNANTDLSVVMDTLAAYLQTQDVKPPPTTVSGLDGVIAQVNAQIVMVDHTVVQLQRGVDVPALQEQSMDLARLAFRTLCSARPGTGSPLPSVAGKAIGDPGEVGAVCLLGSINQLSNDVAVVLADTQVTVGNDAQMVTALATAATKSAFNTLCPQIDGIAPGPGSSVLDTLPEAGDTTVTVPDDAGAMCAVGRTIELERRLEQRIREAATIDVGRKVAETVAQVDALSVMAQGMAHDLVVAVCQEHPEEAIFTASGPSPLAGVYVADLNLLGTSCLQGRIDEVSGRVAATAGELAIAAGAQVESVRQEAVKLAQASFQRLCDLEAPVVVDGAEGATAVPALRALDPRPTVVDELGGSCTLQRLEAVERFAMDRLAEIQKLDPEQEVSKAVVAGRALTASAFDTLCSVTPDPTILGDPGPVPSAPLDTKVIDRDPAGLGATCALDRLDGITARLSGFAARAVEQSEAVKAEAFRQSKELFTLICGAPDALKPVMDLPSDQELELLAAKTFGPPPPILTDTGASCTLERLGALHRKVTALVDEIGKIDVAKLVEEELEAAAGKVREHTVPAFTQLCGERPERKLFAYDGPEPVNPFQDVRDQLSTITVQKQVGDPGGLGGSCMIGRLSELADQVQPWLQKQADAAGGQVGIIREEALAYTRTAFGIICASHPLGVDLDGLVESDQGPSLLGEPSDVNLPSEAPDTDAECSVGRALELEKWAEGVVRAALDKAPDPTTTVEQMVKDVSDQAKEAQETFVGATRGLLDSACKTVPSEESTDATDVTVGDSAIDCFARKIQRVVKKPPTLDSVIGETGRGLVATLAGTLGEAQGQNRCGDQNGINKLAATWRLRTTYQGRTTYHSTIPSVDPVPKDGEDGTDLTLSDLSTAGVGQPVIAQPVILADVTDDRIPDIKARISFRLASPDLEHINELLQNPGDILRIQSFTLEIEKLRGGDLPVAVEAVIAPLGDGAQSRMTAGYDGVIKTAPKMWTATAQLPGDTPGPTKNDDGTETTTSATEVDVHVDTAFENGAKDVPLSLLASSYCVEPAEQAKAEPAKKDPDTMNAGFTPMPGTLDLVLAMENTVRETITPTANPYVVDRYDTVQVDLAPDSQTKLAARLGSVRSVDEKPVESTHEVDVTKVFPGTRASPGLSVTYVSRAYFASNTASGPRSREVDEQHVSIRTNGEIPQMSYRRGTAEAGVTRSSMNVALQDVPLSAGFVYKTDTRGADVGKEDVTSVYRNVDYHALEKKLDLQLETVAVDEPDKNGKVSRHVSEFSVEDAPAHMTVDFDEIRKNGATKLATPNQTLRYDGGTESARHVGLSSTVSVSAETASAAKVIGEFTVAADWVPPKINFDRDDAAVVVDAPAGAIGLVNFRLAEGGSAQTLSRPEAYVVRHNTSTGPSGGAYDSTALQFWDVRYAKYQSKPHTFIDLRVERSQTARVLVAEATRNFDITVEGLPSKLVFERDENTDLLSLAASSMDGTVDQFIPRVYGGLCLGACASLGLGGIQLSEETAQELVPGEAYLSHDSEGTGDAEVQRIGIEMFDVHRVKATGLGGNDTHAELEHRGSQPFQLLLGSPAQQMYFRLVNLPSSLTFDREPKWHDEGYLDTFRVDHPIGWVEARVEHGVAAPVDPEHDGVPGEPISPDARGYLNATTAADGSWSVRGRIKGFSDLKMDLGADPVHVDLTSVRQNFDFAVNDGAVADLTFNSLPSRLTLNYSPDKDGAAKADGILVDVVTPSEPYDVVYGTFGDAGSAPEDDSDSKPHQFVGIFDGEEAISGRLYLKGVKYAHLKVHEHGEKFILDRDDDVREEPIRARVQRLAIDEKTTLADGEEDIHAELLGAPGRLEMVHTKNPAGAKDYTLDYTRPQLEAGTGDVIFPQVQVGATTTSPRGYIKEGLTELEAKLGLIPPDLTLEMAPKPENGFDLNKGVYVELAASAFGNQIPRGWVIPKSHFAQDGLLYDEEPLTTGPVLYARKYGLKSFRFAKPDDDGDICPKSGYQPELNASFAHDWPNPRLFEVEIVKPLRKPDADNPPKGASSGSGCTPQPMVPEAGGVTAPAAPEPEAPAPEAPTGDEANGVTDAVSATAGDAADDSADDVAARAAVPRSTPYIRATMQSLPARAAIAIRHDKEHDARTVAYTGAQGNNIGIDTNQLSEPKDGQLPYAHLDLAPLPDRFLLCFASGSQCGSYKDSTGVPSETSLYLNATDSVDMQAYLCQWGCEPCELETGDCRTMYSTWRNFNRDGSWTLANTFGTHVGVDFRGEKEMGADEGDEEDGYFAVSNKPDLSKPHVIEFASPLDLDVFVHYAIGDKHFPLARGAVAVTGTDVSTLGTQPYVGRRWNIDFNPASKYGRDLDPRVINSHWIGEAECDKFAILWFQSYLAGTARVYPC